VWRSLGVCAAVLLVAPLLAGALGAARHGGPYRVLELPANDFYRYIWPNIVHARRALQGGEGLLWNPYQACGSLFFANIQAGLLYPLTLPMFVLDRDHALAVNVIAHLCIAGGGVFLLARALGLSTLAALCGGLALEFAGAVLILAGWGPILIGTYAWMPVAAWRAERLVQEPTRRNAVWLGLVLTLQLLAGLPQTLFFTYQLVALRLAWALLMRETRQWRALIPLTAAAALLPLGLAAVQLAPSMEMAAESLRRLPLDSGSIGPGFSWRLLTAMAGSLVAFPVDRFLVVLAALALLGLRQREHRRHIVFWSAVLVVYLVLSLGPGSPLWAIYQYLPLSTTFRGSQRLIWVSTLAVAVLVTFGCDAIIARLPRALRWSPAIAILAVAIWCGATPLRAIRPEIAYDDYAAGWSFLRQRLSPFDRVAIVGGALPDFAAMPKSATLFSLPAIYDYEPQMSLRYVQFFSWMRSGRGMRNVADWYWVHDDLLPRTLRRPLFDLTAAKFIAVEARNDVVEAVLGDTTRLLGEPGGLRVYENSRALPRVRWVPTAVVRATDAVLPLLADPDHTPRRAVVLEQTPDTGFLGGDPDARGDVEIVADRPERLVLRVRAAAPGFVVVADQWSAGWRADVDGRAVDVLHADYAFRAVEVPAGEVEVTFFYRPRWLLIGALITLLTAVAAVVLLRRAPVGAPE